jgi:hypothetical protein
MGSLQILYCDPTIPNRAKRIAKHVWDTQKQTIEDLYIQQDFTLEDLMSIMSERLILSQRTYAECGCTMEAACSRIGFGFLTVYSRRQYVEKLRLWKLQKHVPGRVMRSACRKANENPQRRSFVYRGSQITENAMSRYRRRHESLGPALSSAACGCCAWKMTAVYAYFSAK